MIFNEVYVHDTKSITFENYIDDTGNINGTMLKLEMPKEAQRYYHNILSKLRDKTDGNSFAAREYLLKHGWSFYIETDNAELAARWTNMGVEVLFMSNKREDAQYLLDNVDDDSYTIVRGADKLKKYN